MCLGIPGRVATVQRDEVLGLVSGRVDFGGILKQVNLSYTPEVQPGDYVVVHVGFSISRIDEQEAHRVFDFLKQAGALDELENEDEGRLGIPG